MHKSNYDPRYITVNFAMKAEMGVEVQIYFSFDLGDRGVWIFNVRLLPLYPLEKKPAPVVQKSGWTPEPVLRGAGNLTSTGTPIPGPHIQ